MGATVSSLTEFVRLEAMTCGQCGVTFAMPDTMRRERIADRQTFYCPNGHPRAFCGETEAERLRRELETEKAARRRAEELRLASLKEAEHNAREWRKTKTRLRNLRERTKNGVCPCCNRSFTQLARHIATKHPDYASEDSERST